MMIIVVNVGLLRRDAYGRYKQELDCLYALGEPQLERAAKSQTRLRDTLDCNRPNARVVPFVAHLFELEFLSKTTGTASLRFLLLSLFHTSPCSRLCAYVI